MKNSRIASLPENVRQQVNRRLQAGETAVHLVEWINALPEAQAVLFAESSEPMVNEEDVSNWQQGGYRDWLDQQGALAEVRRVVAEAKELSQAADGALTDKLAIWTAGRYAIATRQLAAESRNGGVDWNLLRALCHDLVDLRRGDHSAESLRIERERLEMERSEKKEDLENQFWEWAKANQEKICQGSGLTVEEKKRRATSHIISDAERAAIVNKVDEILGLSEDPKKHDSEGNTMEASTISYSI